MSLAAWEKDQARKLQIRRRILQHHEQVTHNVSKTCRFFGVSRSQFYIWLRRYRQLGDLGLRDRPPGPRVSPLRTPPHIEALVLQLRRERRYGAVRLSLYLQRYYQVYLSPPTILRILREHHMPKVSWKRYRPRPRRRPELRIPGQSVQVDVKHIRMGSGRFYQFTALDEATRYRVLQIYDHNSVRSALDFVNELQKRLPAAIQRIRTDNDSSFGAEFTWHLHDLGIEHRRNPPGCPEANGKVERSHRTDEDEFYRRFTFSSAQELRHLLHEWEREYNHGRPHLALRGKTPAERLCELRIRAPETVRESA
jgi:transposase InsO family protein